MKGKQTYSATNQQLDPITGYKTTITVKTEDPSVIRNLLGNNPTFKENPKTPPKKAQEKKKPVKKALSYAKNSKGTTKKTPPKNKR